MGQAGEHPAGFAQGAFSQFRLNPAKPITAPHGAASVDDGHGRFAVGSAHHLPETVAQRSGQGAVEPGGSVVYLHLPLLAATVRAFPGGAAEAVIVVRFEKQHGKLLLAQKEAHTPRYALPENQ